MEIFIPAQDIVNPLEHPSCGVREEMVAVGGKGKVTTVFTCDGAEGATTVKLVGYVGIKADDFILPPPAPALF
jgi:hypothetical protein